MDLPMSLDNLRRAYPEKFAPEEAIFRHIHRGDRLFIGTACGEPQYLLRSLFAYLEAHPKAFCDVEVLHVWTLGIAPYADVKFKDAFRHNTFFVGPNARQAVNAGLADYSPIFLSQVPDLFRKGLLPVDAALIQTSLPNEQGYLSLGISVDIVKAALERARLVIAQANPRMPRVHGDGFIHLRDVDFVVEHDEPLLEYAPEADTEIARQIGKYVSRLVRDGDTIQVGYGATPNAIIYHLAERRHLGIHTELLSDGLVDLIRRGVVDNSRKTLNRGKTVASFCMGRRDTYDFIHDNPSVELRAIDYTNDPLRLARHENMVAINSALEIDLTGQATAESLGGSFFSGIGGQADFMRGAVLAPGGRSILTLASTAREGTVSRIVPALPEGAGATLNRGDVHYVVTEYGIAYLHGKNVRERAMELIAIAHPDFRAELIEEARRRRLIYADQAFIPGKEGEYPESLETWRTTRTGLEIFLRPVKISDEPRLKDFFYSLSDQSLYTRFMTPRRDMPHERLQEFVVINYAKEMVILATVRQENREEIVGLGQYAVDEPTHTAEAAFLVRDDYQNRGVGGELVAYLIWLARKQGLLGLSAETLKDNTPMVHLFQKHGFTVDYSDQEVYVMSVGF
ncbi:MAG: GNAT family N-acetyltransferase [Candidatus Zixiibacteriota bacterium]|nr:MAG: GNAT family N-acetyltransferase [candidate division Zixibacteria bacterium]